MLRLALVLLMAFSGGSAVADWIKVTEASDGKVSHYVDPSTMRRMGTLMQAVTLTDYQQPQVISQTQRFLSVKMQDEFNCANRSGRHLSLVALAGNMGTGPVVTTEIRPAPERVITPDSADDDMWKHVCGKN